MDYKLTETERAKAAELTAACAQKPVRLITTTRDIECRQLRLSAEIKSAKLDSAPWARKPARKPGEYQRDVAAASISRIKEVMHGKAMAPSLIADEAHLATETVRRILVAHDDVFVRDNPGKKTTLWRLK
jgi:hypothetical protein